MVEFGAERGIDTTTILAGSGVSVDQLGDPALTVAAEQDLRIVSNLVEALDAEPGVGVEVGARYHMGVLGIFGYGLITSPTLGDAALCAMRHHALTAAYCLPTVSIEDDTATLSLGPTGDHRAGRRLPRRTRSRRRR